LELDGIDAGLLLALEALLQTRNVTHAAARLGISQPALSARLTRLQRVLADPIFVPAASGRGVIPTHRAAGLQDDLARVLAGLRRIVDEPAAFDPVRTRRTFVVAMHENPAAVLMPGLVARMMVGAPEARIAFVSPGPDIMDRLEHGAADLLVSGPERTGSNLMRRLLFEDGFVTAQRHGHPRGVQPLDLDAFCALDHLLISADGGGFHGLVDDALAAVGRSRRVAASIQSYALAPAVLAASDCLCTLPRRFFAAQAAAVDLLPTPIVLPSVQMFALWHPRSQGDPGHVWLRKRLYQSAGCVPECLSGDPRRQTAAASCEIAQS